MSRLRAPLVSGAAALVVLAAAPAATAEPVPTCPRDHLCLYEDLQFAATPVLVEVSVQYTPPVHADEVVNASDIDAYLCVLTIGCQHVPAGSSSAVGSLPIMWVLWE